MEKSKRQSAIYKHIVRVFILIKNGQRHGFRQEAAGGNKKPRKPTLGLTKAGCMRSLFVASRLQVRRDIREYAPANRASVASTCPWVRYNLAYFFLGHGPLFFFK